MSVLAQSLNTLTLSEHSRAQRTLSLPSRRSTRRAGVFTYRLLEQVDQGMDRLDSRLGRAIAKAQRIAEKATGTPVHWRVCRRGIQGDGHASRRPHLCAPRGPSLVIIKGGCFCYVRRFKMVRLSSFRRRSLCSRSSSSDGYIVHRLKGDAYNAVIASIDARNVVLDCNDICDQGGPLHWHRLW